jgi:DNA-binding NtrC family response regulator
MARILIVEDEEQVRVLAESILEDAGHQTLSASSLVEVRGILNTDDGLDLVFTDLNLEDENEGGLQVGQLVATKLPQMPVLYTSGRNLTDGMRALFVEPSAFLPKPYTIDDLVEAVDRLLDRSDK